MTAITTPNVGLKAGFLDGEGAWGDDMNKNLRTIDALLQGNVIDKDLSSPPGSPASGDAYIVPSSATGTWATHDGKIAIWAVGDDLTSAWFFVTPREGWRMWVVDEDAYYRFTGSVWSVDTKANPTLLESQDDAGTSYTFALDDHNRKRRFTAATSVTVTVPANSTAAFPIGSLLPFRQVGAGQVVLTAAGGVTINIPSDCLGAARAVGSEMLLHKVGLNVWDLTGDLEAV